MITLRKIRHLKKQTLEDVHKETDISVSKLSLIETGKRDPKPEEALRLEIWSGGAVSFKAIMLGQAAV